MDKKALEAFKALDKLNPEATILSETSLSTVDEWFDTGCMVLNSIISGSLYGGIPKGRITGFAGPSMCGKTYIINKILGKAQQKGLIPVVFDTEMAVDDGNASAVGLDPEKTKYVPVNTIEDCRNQLVALLDGIESSGMNGKFIISIDSLGNLASEKEVNDAEKGKAAMDMGMRAKSLKSMMRLLTYKAARTGTTILFANHTYDDPAAMFPSLVKNQAGGKGPVYLASVLVQLASRSEKQDNANEEDEITNNTDDWKFAIYDAGNGGLPKTLISNTMQWTPGSTYNPTYLDVTDTSGGELTLSAEVKFLNLN